MNRDTNIKNKKENAFFIIISTVVIFMVLILGSGIVGIAFTGFEASPSPIQKNIESLLSYGLIFAIFYKKYRRLGQSDESTGNSISVVKPNLVLSFFTGVIFSLSVASFLYACSAVSNESGRNILSFAEEGRFLPLALLVNAVVVPIVEEVVLRS